VIDATRRHIVCLLGAGLDFDDLERLAQRVGGAGFQVDREFSQHEADDRMPAAFAACADRVEPTFDEADRADVVAHTDVLYLLSPPISDDAALDVAHRTLVVTAALLRAGATAAKGECSGIAHGRERWLELADLADGAAGGADPAFDLASALHLAWVRRPISSSSVASEVGWLYSCGMHLLGQPDIEYPEDGPDWLTWMDTLALYLLAERPETGVHSGEGFRLVADGDRRVLEHTDCGRYDADDPFFNPYGYWRLNPDASSS
jgi:hypothetical protein